jgi:predicted homoserine dehydrogenase-like protein
VTFAAGSDFVARCFRDYGLVTDATGEYAALYRPSHLIGLETPVSVLAAGLLGEPTGSPAAFHADVCAVAKRDLPPGETLDGEGGFTVAGRLVAAGESIASGALPIGLAHDLRVIRPVRAGATVTTEDVERLPESIARRMRSG